MKWTKTQFAEIRDYLRRDSEFKKHYMRARGGTYGYRRSSIGDYLSPWLGVGRRRSLPVGLPAFAGHRARAPCPAMPSGGESSDAFAKAGCLALGGLDDHLRGRLSNEDRHAIGEIQHSKHWHKRV